MGTGMLFTGMGLVSQASQALKDNTAPSLYFLIFPSLWPSHRSRRRGRHFPERDDEDFQCRSGARASCRCVWSGGHSEMAFEGVVSHKLVISDVALRFWEETSDACVQIFSMKSVINH
jgi:hypothetical protein